MYQIRRKISSYLATLLMSMLFAQTVQAEDAPNQFENLVPVDDAQVAAAYIDPNADFSVFERVMILDTTSWGDRIFMHNPPLPAVIYALLDVPLELLGLAPFPKVALYVFMAGHTNGTTFSEQLIEGGIQLGWETRLVPFGKEITAAIYALGFASLFLIYEQLLIVYRIPEYCFRAFLHNHWVGAIVFAGIMGHYYSL